MDSFIQKTVTLEITSADVTGVLDGFYKRHIPVRHIVRIDDLTVRVDVLDEYMNALENFLAKRGDQFLHYKKSGIFWQIRAFLHRPVLVVGIIMLLFVSTFLPTRILFVEVQGNTQIPTNKIIACAELCGIRFGASRTSVRSEKLKNALLEIMPQLQWAAVNTKGCVAVISVQERTQQHTQTSTAGVCSIVADRDGVITACTVTKGAPLCKVGQAVRAGDVLVSGYNDCGLHMQALRAEAEIYAQTKRTIASVRPLNCTYKGKVTAIEKKYSLIFGKKKINLYKDSGISDATCDKIYKDYALVLPGGFCLPVAVCVEVWTYYDLTDEPECTDNLRNEVSTLSKQYILSQMVAGTILNQQWNVQNSDHLFVLNEEMTCHEMIGRVKYEENLSSNGKDN